MSIERMVASLASQIDDSTPRNVHPTGSMEEPSRPATWSVVSLIGALVAVYALIVYVVIRVFDAIIFTKSEAIVLAQFENQKTIALGLLVIFGVLIAAVVWAAAKLRVRARMGAAAIDLGGDDGPTAHPVAKIKVTAPEGNTVVVDNQTAEDEMPMEEEPAPPAKAVTLPLKGSPTEYGD